ncbi:hypothetical protein ONS95_012878 [Cadophora gregata]|uniref:uncharacterized protein n=1 Tax=Cadophora gregata TaxID=51156 RepID=UPI0026DAC3B1|nr:uncharacterized protein ONS95_012878 [Cadophora gregata]KAK0115827.1 hypothetical protein ONS95_012878 [Cadophora gregata]
MLTYIYQFLGFTALGIATTHHPKCKAIPGTNSWPSQAEWSHLNTSLSGRLLQPSPPGAVCHPTQATFDPLSCVAVAAGWLTTQWHTDNPVSTIENNWNNDTCLPVPTLPCSGKGYPVYVVNATCAEDVKKGVDFARENHVRLVVKGTGHDYLGRSVAPKSLSIWTHYMRGLEFYDGFKPKGCRKSIDGAAITAAADTQMLELDEQAHLKNLTIVSGGAGTVGVGGYLTGGGQGALSSTYGLGADQVLEMEIVTPGGDILTINECQNRDLFWAMRGGGGSTFGVITSVTIRAYPSTELHVASFLLGTGPGTEEYWDVMADILSQYPALDEQGLSGYAYIAHNVVSAEMNITSAADGFAGAFFLPAFHSSNTSLSLETVLKTLFADATAAYPGKFMSTVTVKTFPDFWAWYKDNNGPLDAGHNEVLGSRLIDGATLTGNRTALKQGYRAATPPGGLTSVFLVGGKGTRNAKPRGGGNSVNPAWRKAYIHSVIGASWNPLDSAEEAKQKALLTDVYVEGLRKMAPDSGAYMNEASLPSHALKYIRLKLTIVQAYPDEPDFQHAFWGENYERLLAIKKKVDPQDVLWCHPCVGNEGWELVDGVLCKK